MIGVILLMQLRIKPYPNIFKPSLRNLGNTRRMTPLSSNWFGQRGQLYSNCLKPENLLDVLFG